MAGQVIQAPPSPQWNRAARIARIRALRAMPANVRSAAETKELINTLVGLLPPDVSVS